MGWRGGESGLNWGYKTNQNNFVSIRPAGPRHHINERNQLLKYVLQGAVQPAAHDPNDTKGIKHATGHVYLLHFPWTRSRQRRIPGVSHQ